MHWDAKKLPLLKNLRLKNFQMLKLLQELPFYEELRL